MINRVRRGLLILCSLVVVAFGTVIATGTADAATISVGAGCTFADAFQAANTDAAVGGCAAGNGADTISLSPSATTDVAATLPTVVDDLTIVGDNSILGVRGFGPGFIVDQGARLTFEGLDLRVSNSGVQVREGLFELLNSVASGLFIAELDSAAADARIENSSSTAFQTVVGRGRDVLIRNSRFEGGQSAVNVQTSRQVVVERSYFDFVTVRAGSGELIFENSTMWRTEGGIGGTGEVRSSTIVGTIGGFGGQLRVTSSIIWAGFECSNEVIDGGFNIVLGTRDNEADCPPGFTYISSPTIANQPQDLGCLTPTPTGCVLLLPLLAGSPAINASQECPGTDQRGAPRPAGGACDAGAHEGGQLGPLLCGGQPVTILWGPGETATAGPDVILGSAGNDTIRSLGGDDVVCGLGGTDTILGGPGNDTLLGGGDADDLRGQGGSDTLMGEDGVDQFFGGSGQDTIDTGPGGNAGTSRLVQGQSGADTILGSPQDDVLDGGLGQDEIHGNSGNDILNGGRSGDDLFGGDGDDQLFGGPDRDDLDGGAGTDDCNGGGATNDTATATCETTTLVP